MTNKFIDDIRRIAKTDDILKRLPNLTPDVDKSAIGTNRGVGLADKVFDTCQVLYSSDSGSYTVDGIIAGTAGPKIQDGDNNHCTILNTITGMREIDSLPYLFLTLKPDGLFTKTNNYIYSTDPINQRYLEEPGFFDNTTSWGFPTPQDAINKTVDIYNDIGPGTFTSSDPVFFTDMTQAMIDDNNVNFSLLYPVYSFDIIAEDDTTYSWLVYGLPNDYNYKLDPASTGLLDEYKYLYYFPSTWDGIDSINWGARGVDDVPSHTFELRVRTESDYNWVPDSSDSITPIKYKDGVSIVRFQFGSGWTRYGMVRPAKDGGLALFETDSTGNTATGNAFIYRRDRTLTTVIPVAQMGAYLA